MRRRCTSLGAGLAVVALGVAAPVATAAPGELDPTFGSGGIVTTPFPSFDSSKDNAVAIDAQGRIVTTGNVRTTTNRLALARYLPDGSLDPSFGTGGRVTTQFASGGAIGLALAIQSDGAIVVAGIDFIGSGSEGFVTRYLSSGTPDPAFNGGNPVQLGTVTANEFDAVLLVPGDKIVAGGQSPTGGWTLTRLTATGGVDSTFDGDGTARVHNDAGHCGATNQSGLAKLIALPGDLILVGGLCGNGSVGNPIVYGLARFKGGATANNTALDTTFGTNGASTVTPEPGVNNFGGPIARLDDGKIVQTGQIDFGGSNGHARIGVVRRNADGSLDTTYGAGGSRIFNLNGNQATSGDVEIDAAGRALVMASRPDDTGGFGLARLTPEGGLDQTFGAGGVTLIPFGDPAPPMGVSSNPSRQVVQADGKVVVAGFARIGGNDTQTLMRFTVDPTAPSGTGGGGDAGGGAGTVGGAQTAAPLVPASALGSLRVTGLRYDGKRITGLARCASSPAAACTARLTIVYGKTTGKKADVARRRKKRRKRKPITVGSANLSVPAGTNQTVKLTPTRRGKALLRRSKRGITVTLTLTNAATNETSTTKSGIIRAIKKKKRKSRPGSR